MPSYLINKKESEVIGSFQVPASKSISNRLLIIRELTKKAFAISNLSDSDDTRVLVYGLESKNELIDIGHAGTSMRFLTAFFASQKCIKVLTGSERMKNRPIGKLVDALLQLGAVIEYSENEGYPPILIEGKKLNGGNVSIDSSVSSQFISALLLVAPTFKNGLELQLENQVISASYIKMTLILMKELGISANIKDNVIHIPHQVYRPKPMTVEGDWSGASYWYEMAALANNADIFLPYFWKNSMQGDCKIVEIFKPLGVGTSFENNGIRLSKVKQTLDFFEFDFLENPDLVQTIAVTCIMKGIPFRLSGTQSLRIKETDRITALQIELGKFGARLEYDPIGILSWNGMLGAPLKSTLSIATYDDHRMAMAFAPIALVNRSVIIENPDVVSKSYPTYWENLKQAGFEIE